MIIKLSPREVALTARLRKWGQYVRETCFNNRVLKESNKDQQEYIHQLHGLKTVLIAEVTRLECEAVLLRDEIAVLKDALGVGEPTTADALNASYRDLAAGD